MESSEGGSNGERGRRGREKGDRAIVESLRKPSRRNCGEVEENEVELPRGETWKSKPRRQETTSFFPSFRVPPKYTIDSVYHVYLYVDGAFFFCSAFHAVSLKERAGLAIHVDRTTKKERCLVRNSLYAHTRPCTRTCVHTQDGSKFVAESRE